MRIHRTTAGLAGLVLGAALLGACASDADDDPGAAGDDFAPVTIDTAWGTTEITEKPERVAVTSAGDLHIALALGVVPVISWSYEGVDPMPYETEAIEALGADEVPRYDGTDGTDYKAIAAAEPDVVLATNSWSNDDDFAELSTFAKVVAVEDKADVDTASWQERLELAAKALGLSDKAQEVVAETKQLAKDAGAKHPEFAGTSYAYMIVHPDQLTYQSSSDSDASVIEDLGLVRAPASKDFSTSDNAVSIENVDVFDADVLLVAYPFGDEGLLSADELQSNELFQSIPAVKAGRWAIVDGDSGLASEVAYPDVLGYRWVIGQITPVIASAIAGEGNTA